MVPGYVPIEIDSLVLDTTPDFQLFLQGKSDSMVLYRGSDTSLDDVILNRLKDNSHESVYVSDEEWGKYQDYLAQNLSKIAADESVPVEKRCQMVYTTSTHIMEQVFDEPRTADAVKRAQHLISPTVSMILSGEDAMRRMIQLTSHDYYTYTHSVNVCIFSVSLTTKIFPDLPVDEFERLGSGYLLHDIGKRKDPPGIINKDGPLTGEEWKIMRQHPQLGYEILCETGADSQEASIIALQHHERYDGGGYPSRLSGDEIHIWAKVCCIADTFDALTTKRSYRDPCTSFEALQIMKNEMIRNFDRDFFQQFIELFRFAI